MAGAVLVGVVVCTLVGWSWLRRYTVGFVSSVSVSSVGRAITDGMVRPGLTCWLKTWVKAVLPLFQNFVPLLVVIITRPVLGCMLVLSTRTFSPSMR